MTFNKCSIRGKLYGYITDEAGNDVTDPEVIFVSVLFSLGLNSGILEIKTIRIRRER